MADNRVNDGHGAARRRRVTVGAVILVALAAAGAIHYRIGRNWLVYAGVDVTPPGIELDGPSPYPLAEPRNDLPGLANFAFLSGELCRGAQPSAEGCRELARMGVRTVVNLRETGSDRLALRGTGLRYAHIRVNPSHIDEPEAIAFLKLFDDTANLPAFVHCQKGSDRTGIVCALYRVVRQGWPADEAVKELPRFGYHEVWVGLLEYLRDVDPGALKENVAVAPPTEVEVMQ